MIKDAIDFAIQYTLQHLNEDEMSHIVKESLIRAEATWANIKLHGFQECNITFEQFIEQLQKKNNIVLMTDEEVANMYKSVKAVNAIKELANKL